MNIENMLQEYTDIPETVRKLNSELNDLLGNKDSLYGKINASRITNMPFGTETTDPTYEAVRQIVDKYDKRIFEIRDRISELLDNKTALERALQCLALEEYRVIELRYFNRYKMKRIPYIMHYSLAQCYNFHNAALDKLEIEIDAKTNIILEKIRISS